MTWALQLAAVLAVPLGVLGAAWAAIHVYNQARSPRPREAGVGADGSVHGAFDGMPHPASDSAPDSDAGGCGDSGDSGGGDCGGGGD